MHHFIVALALLVSTTHYKNRKKNNNFESYTQFSLAWVWKCARVVLYLLLVFMFQTKLLISVVNAQVRECVCVWLINGMKRSTNDCHEGGNYFCVLTPSVMYCFVFIVYICCSFAVCVDHFFILFLFFRIWFPFSFKLLIFYRQFILVFFFVFMAGSARREIKSNKKKIN